MREARRVRHILHMPTERELLFQIDILRTCLREAMTASPMLFSMSSVSMRCPLFMRRMAVMASLRWGTTMLRFPSR